MPESMTDDEQAIRDRLFTAARQVRSALYRCPAVNELDLVDHELAYTAVDEANRALLGAWSCLDELEQLRDVSGEAMMIVATGRVGLDVAREAITALTAALDMRSSAA